MQSHSNAPRVAVEPRPNRRKWSAFGILLVWLTVLGVLYAAMAYYLKPKPIVVTASGDLVIPRARDGHFYATGSINGKPLKFMIDTGATLVVVSEPFARDAGLSGGMPTTFSTANGTLPGRVVSDVAVSVGPMAVSAVRIGVGLVGGAAGDALLGQSFLSKFDIMVNKDQMTLRKR